MLELAGKLEEARTRLQRNEEEKEEAKREVAETAAQLGDEPSLQSPCWLAAFCSFRFLITLLDVF